jgi:hypothetical protein
MNSPKLRRVKAVKTLAGSGNTHQKESDNTRCFPGWTPKIIAKSDGVLMLPKASVTVLGEEKRRLTKQGAKSGSNGGLEEFF